MLKGRWQGFEIESGENAAPLLLTHWVVLKQTLIFALFSLPLFTGVGLWLSKRFLDPPDQIIPPNAD